LNIWLAIVRARQGAREGPRVKGRAEVSNYHDNYARLRDWRFALGTVDGDPNGDDTE
jgi:hypothetical protein